MKKLIYKWLKSVIFFLFKLEFTVTSTSHLRMKNPFKVTNIPYANIDLYLDYRESLDQCYASNVLDFKAMKFLDKHLEKGQINWFVDVGTNQGFYTCYVLKKYPHIKSLNIEPDPYHQAKFEKNLLLNNIEKRAHLFDGAVSDTDTDAELMINNAGNRAGNSIIIDQREWTKQNENEVITVKCKPLSNLLKEFGVNHDFILKIDIEGAEFPVLKQFFATSDASLYPRVIIAEEAMRNIELTGGSVVELLIKNGYSLVGHEEVNFFFELKH